MERERGGGDDEVEHEVGGEEVREEARREDVAEDLGQIEHGRVWHDRESERPKTMRSARPDRPGAGRAPATSPAPSVSPKRNGYLLRINQILVYIRYYIQVLDITQQRRPHYVQCAWRVSWLEHLPSGIGVIDLRAALGTMGSRFIVPPSAHLMT